MKVTKIYPDSDGLVDVDDRYLMAYFPEEDFWEWNPCLDFDLRLHLTSLVLNSSSDWRSELERLSVNFSDAYEFYSDLDSEAPYQILYYDCGLSRLFQ